MSVWQLLLNAIRVYKANKSFFAAAARNIVKVRSPKEARLKRTDIGILYGYAIAQREVRLQSPDSQWPG